jgi:hypothetical protein
MQHAITASHMPVNHSRSVMSAVSAVFPAFLTIVHLIYHDQGFTNLE